ncbi:50S ribosomal protein L18 [Dechloromonas sp. TW-R-39-2]|jgi:large subunit ribosomal protein L18|uniref:50S ribosomal protein L18 n=1 Tax=Dechloromonas TaxID=73029 RepID=UPI00193E915C|nr:MULTISPECIES: 50S ribosomal protein L18 [Dechloromonas]QRM18596.1 50S ribosomal protein L18 [Dechloromonas sp. TW-R-39-2]UCV12025.1 50S ribosomal protein L18 [Dechloromonas denitrificans]
MFNRKEARLRRARQTRAKIAELKAVRLCVNRTNCHIYAQIISPCGGKVLASASTLDVDVRKDIPNGGNKAAATSVGKLIAERAKAAGIERVAFDRSGLQYHGRVQALAEAAREAGLQF